MNSTTLSDFPAVRLASGVEPLLKWPATGTSAVKYEPTNLKAMDISPSSGPEGTIVTLVVQAIQAPVKLAFNSLLVETRQMQGQGITSLVATVPPFSQTHSSTPVIPISICCLDGDNMVNDTWLAAEFTYTDRVQAHSRSFSADEFTMSKRPEMTKDAFFIPAEVSHGLMSAYGYDCHPHAHQAHQLHQQPQKRDYVYDSSMPMFPTNSAENLSLMPNSGGIVPGPMASSPLQNAPSSYYSIPDGYAVNNHTPEIPETAYQRPLSKNSASRISLDISGDLLTMTQGWSRGEFEDRRRLVQFWREKESNKITCRFQPIALGEYSRGDSIVVSCIYWMERDSFLITSVDCIYLLESLMSVRFSVEEKNRIRRNLEGFRPLTVSKNKPDSADFFKLIMAFPKPKPRHIEKDVKVFPWKTLQYALKKIITKYTASPSHPRLSEPQIENTRPQNYWLFPDRSKSLDVLAFPSTTPSPMISPTVPRFSANMYPPATPSSSSSSMQPISPHVGNM